MSMIYDNSRGNNMYNYGINEAVLFFPTFNQISTCTFIHYRVYIVHIHYTAYDIISDSTPT